MKKLSWLLAAALPIALMFSCQKQIASSTDTAANRNPVRMAGCSSDVPPGFVQVTTSPVVPVAGSPLTVTVCVPCGSMTSMTVLLNGVAVPGATSTGGGGQVCRSVTFTPSAADCETNTYSIDINYNNSGGATCDSEDFPDAPYCNSGVVAQAAAICIEVTAPCTDEEALTITGDAVVSDVADGWATVTATYCVTACKAVTGVRVQGGATAGGNVGAQEISWSDHTLATAGYPNYNNNNIVYSWTKDFAAGETKCFTFSYRRALTACGDVTGAWSAKSANGLSEAHIDPLAGCP